MKHFCHFARNVWCLLAIHLLLWCYLSPILHLQLPFEHRQLFLLQVKLFLKFWLRAPLPTVFHWSRFLVRKRRMGFVNLSFKSCGLTSVNFLQVVLGGCDNWTVVSLSRSKLNLWHVQLTIGILFPTFLPASIVTTIASGCTILGPVMHMGLQLHNWCIQFLGTSGSVKTAYLVFVKIFGLYFPQILRTEQGSNVIENVSGAFPCSETSRSWPSEVNIVRDVLSLPSRGSHVCSPQNILKPFMKSIFFNEALQKENGSFKSCIRVPMIKFKNSTESCFCDLSNGHIILPLQKCLLKLIGLSLAE